MLATRRDNCVIADEDFAAAASGHFFGHGKTRTAKQPRHCAVASACTLAVNPPQYTPNVSPLRQPRHKQESPLKGSGETFQRITCQSCRGALARQHHTICTAAAWRKIARPARNVAVHPSIQHQSLSQVRHRPLRNAAPSTPPTSTQNTNTTAT